jgi:hypothetical protein
VHLLLHQGRPKVFSVASICFHLLPYPSAVQMASDEADLVFASVSATFNCVLSNFPALAHAVLTPGTPVDDRRVVASTTFATISSVCGPGKTEISRRCLWMQTTRTRLGLRGVSGRYPVCFLMSVHVSGRWPGPVIGVPAERIGVNPFHMGVSPFI